MPRAGRNSGKMEVLPSQKAAPAAVFLDAQGTEADLRRQLRLKTGVVELSAEISRRPVIPWHRSAASGSRLSKDSGWPWSHRVRTCS